MGYPQSAICFLIIVQVYVIARFAFQCSFKFGGAYSLKYFIIAMLVPFAGYFVAINLVKRKQAELEAE